MSATAFLIAQFIGLAFLFICSAFFSSAETALFSLNPIQIRRLKKSTPTAGRRVELMLAAPTQLLSTLLVGNTVVNIAAASLGYTVAERLVPSHGETVAIPVMTLLLLLVGEVAPKRLAMSRPERLAAFYSGLLQALIAIMTPARVLLEKTARLFRTDLHAANRTLSEDEFLTVVEVGEEEGVLDEEERDMVDGIIRMEETQASDVMTPRVDLVGIDLEDSPEERERVVGSVRYRYLPVYRDTLDHIEGFLDVPLFLLADKRKVEAMMIPPFYVPETAPLDTLLKTFQKNNRRVAIVVDEFGGTAGLITRGDILEEIVDDVDTEFGEQKESIEKTGENAWLVDGSTSLEEINHELDMDLEAEGADRIAGWVVAQAERIPRTGEVVEAQNCRATVQTVRRQRITLVMLEKMGPSTDKDREESAW